MDTNFPKREADFRTKCAVCGDWIKEGDIITKKEYDDEWIHELCLDENDYEY